MCLLLLVLSIEHVGVEQHLSCCLTTSYLFANLLLALLSLTATWNGWFACLPNRCLGLEYISLCQPLLHGLYISIAPCIIFIARKHMWLHSISGDFRSLLLFSVLLLLLTFWYCMIRSPSYQGILEHFDRASISFARFKMLLGKIYALLAPMPTAHHFVNHMVSYFSSPSYLQNKWLIFFGLSFIFTSLFLPAFRCDLRVKWLESMLLLTFFLASSELLGGNLLMITVRCCARRFWYIASCVWHNEIPLTNVLQLFKT